MIYLRKNSTVLLFSGVSVGDFNADGMDDLYCHTPNGNTTVAISTVPGKRTGILEILTFLYI